MYPDPPGLGNTARQYALLPGAINRAESNQLIRVCDVRKQPHRDRVHKQSHYNEHRPHRAHDRLTPGEAYRRTPKAGPPASSTGDGNYRLRYDHVDTGGKVSLRRSGRMHHLGVGKAHAKKRVMLLVDEHTVTVAQFETGDVLSTHIINTTKSYWRNEERESGRWSDSR